MVNSCPKMDMDRNSKGQKTVDFCIIIVWVIVSGFYGLYFPLIFIFEPPPHGFSFNIVWAAAGLVLYYVISAIRYLKLWPARKLGSGLGKVIANHMISNKQQNEMAQHKSESNIASAKKD